MRSGSRCAASATLAGFVFALAAGQGVAKEPSRAPSAAQPSFVFGPISGKASPQISVPVRNLPHEPAEQEKARPVAPRVNPLRNEPDHGRRGTWTRAQPPRDPLIAHSQNKKGTTPPPDTVFSGLGNPFAANGSSPGDPNGDTDQQHFVQMVNATKVGIYDRDGNLVIPAFDLGSLWTKGACSKNLGDPQVRYDRLASRWILSQIERKDVCFAISQTPDPVGTYYLYDFSIGDLPDYFKLGVWRNAYYVGMNETSYTAYAFDRNKMLVGEAAGFIKFSGETNFLMPGDSDGTDWASDAGYFYTFKDGAFHGGKDRIELFRFTPNFNKPEKSTFKLASTFNIAPFTYTVCGFFKMNCISQKGTKQKVDAVSEWPMQRFEYRKMGDTWQELVGNFTVGGGKGTAGAAIRWFELRNVGKGWKLWQEGTQDPGDGLDRFMGSIAMDKDGNIALGYSASSKNDYPSIRYATRLFSDAKGTLGPEVVLAAGGGAQTGSNRWGDYSGMSVDPGSGCQFWYTNQYYPTTSDANWATAIGAFTIPKCSGGTGKNAYDAAKDFSGKRNPDGPWSYRYSASGTLNGDYTLLNTLYDVDDWHDASENPVTLHYWANPGNDFPHISANKTGGQLHINFGAGNVYLDPDQIYVHPDTLRPAVLSFTAPVSGRASVKYSFAHIDCHGGNGINWHLDLDTASGQHTNLAFGSLKTNTCTGDGSTGPLKKTVSVGAGDRINFIIDSNSSLGYDSSEISAKISLQ